MNRRLPALELVLCLTCLWTAWYHTPAGALLRTTFAWIFRLRTDARPLLAYYGAGTLVPPRVYGPPLAGPVPAAEALGYGIASIQAATDPAAAAARLHELSGTLGSDEAAVLAFFCGEEAARYAVEQTRSTRLADLGRALPPRSQVCVTRAAQALMLGGAYALSWPLPETIRISSGFGVRADPVLGGRRFHAGVDLPAPPGTGVRVTADGVVRRAGSDDLNGRILIVDHGRGIATVYCHNDQLLARDGEHVHKGDIIARSGNTGRSTGPHLHYQLELAGEPVDPLRFRSHRPKPAPIAAGAD